MGSKVNMQVTCNKVKALDVGKEMIGHGRSLWQKPAFGYRRVVIF